MLLTLFCVEVVQHLLTLMHAAAIFPPARHMTADLICDMVMHVLDCGNIWLKVL